VSRGPVAHHDDISRLKKHCLTLFQAVIGTYSNSTMGGSVVSVLDSGTEARVQIAAATMSGNSLRQIVHTHCASIHQAAKLVAALPRVAWVTAGQAERWQPTTGFMTHIICRLTAKNRDQLRNPTLGNRVWTTFTFLLWEFTKLSSTPSQSYTCDFTRVSTSGFTSRVGTWMQPCTLEAVKRKKKLPIKTRQGEQTGSSASSMPASTHHTQATSRHRNLHTDWQTSRFCLLVPSFQKR